MSAQTAQIKDLAKQKNVARGGRFSWCPQGITRCYKKYAPYTPTGYVFVGYMGKHKVCKCYGTPDSVEKYM